ncbi:MAG: PKD domain-containing protein [Thermoproteota archaeon]
MSEIKDIASGIHTYRSQNGSYPIGNYTDLKSALVNTNILANEDFAKIESKASGSIQYISDGKTFLLTVPVNDKLYSFNQNGFVLASLASSGFSVVVNGPSQLNVNEQATFNAVVNGGTPPYTYSWYGVPSSNNSQVSFAFSVPGNYVVGVVVKDSTGAIVVTTKSVVVSGSINNSPIFSVVINPSAMVVETNTSVTFTASVTGGTPPYTYSWSGGGTPSTGTGNIFVTSWNTGGTKTVSILVKDSMGATATNSVNVTVNATLSVNITGPNTVCSYASATFTASVSGGTPPYTYSWSTIGGTPSTGTDSSFTTQWSTSGSKVVSLTVTDFANISNSATLSITVYSKPSISIAGPTSGYTNTNYTYTASVTGGTPPYTYSWSVGSDCVASSYTSSSIDAKWNSAGTKSLFLTVTDSKGCSNTATYSVNITDLLPLTVSINGSSVLIGSPVVATYSVVVSGGAPPYTYLWSNGSTSSSASYTFQNPGTYTVSVQVTDSLSNSVNVSKTVDVLLPLTVSITGPTSTIVNTPTTYTANVSGGKPPYTYTWSNGGTASSSQYTWSLSGTYTVSINVKDSMGNQVVKSINVQVASALTVTITGPSTGCVNASVTYTSSVSGGYPPYTYSWSGGGTPSTGTGNSFTTQWSTTGSKTISLTVTDSNGYTVNSTYTATVYPSPSVSISGPTTGYVNVNYTYTANVSGGTSPYTYLWSGGGSPATGTNSYFTTQWSTSGTKAVFLTVTDSKGCSNTATYSVSISDIPLSVSITGPTSTSINTYCVYSVTVSGGTPPYNYYWYTSDGSPSSGTSSSFMTLWSSPGTKVVNLIVIDSRGSSKLASLTVTVLPPLSLYLTGTTSGYLYYSYSYFCYVYNGSVPYYAYWSSSGSPSYYPMTSYGIPIYCSFSFYNYGHNYVSIYVQDYYGSYGTTYLDVYMY